MLVGAMRRREGLSVSTAATRNRRDNLSIDYLRERLSYDSKTGVIRWKKSRFKNCVGEIAGHYDKDGYHVVRVDYVIIRVARLAWLFETGAWPIHEIDHKNGVRNDDRFVNLREASRPQNAANRGRDRDNSSGLKGVSWHKHRKKWRATIGVGKKRIHIGFFAEKTDAAAAYKIAAKIYHKEFART